MCTFVHYQGRIVQNVTIQVIKIMLITLYIPILGMYIENVNNGYCLNIQNVISMLNIVCNITYEGYMCAPFYQILYDQSSYFDYTYLRCYNVIWIGSV